MRKPSSDPLPKEKGPSLFLIVMIITGYAMIGFSALNILINPILGLDIPLSIDEMSEGMPTDLEGALSFAVVGVVWTLFWRFWAWRPVRKWMRAHVWAGVLIVVGIVGSLVAVFWVVEVNARRELAEREHVRDSLIAAGVLPEDPEVVSMRLRKAGVVMSNPTLDSLGFCINDSIYRWIGPMELAKEMLEPGKYRLAACSRTGTDGAIDTLDAVEVVVQQAKFPHDDRFIIFNVQSRMNFALLGYGEAWKNGKLDENASESDFQLLGTAFGRRLSQFSLPSANLTLPYHSTFSVFDTDKVLAKLVIVPPEWQGQSDKIKRYAIWSLKLEESRGMMQDFLKMVWMGENERREYIRDRLKRETAEFEAEDK